ncbi:cation transporter HKT1;3 [Cryptomeria japonica]|uniref:cation transporter HKT1;3 n=1 Tax=Cryptomeria japonica TaxID=3369 RepID=UPI0027DA933E|nr:cation transporter HKT1;3 [Cryptomeria japonica]
MTMRSFSMSSRDMPTWVQKPSCFMILHITYFLVLGFMGAFALWMCPQINSEHMSFIDALYCSTSAVTVTGLISVRIQGMHKFQQIVLLLLTVLGSQVFTSLFPLYARRLAYRRILTNQAMAVLSKVQEKLISNESEAKEDAENVKLISNESAAREVKAHHSNSEVKVEVKGVSAYVGKNELGQLLKHLLRYVKGKSSEMMKIVWKRCIWREDFMSVLSKRILQCCKTEDLTNEIEISMWKSMYMEYKALTYLYRIVVAYFLLVQLGAFVLLQIYLFASPTATKILEKNSVNKTFFSAYNAVTSFGNAGYSLLDSSMIPFRNHAFILLFLSFIVLVGNTMFGPCIWVIISVLQRFGKGSRKEVYTYLITNPRNCYTHLFPKNQTLWLIITVMAINTLQTSFFCVLDWNSSSVNGLNFAEKIVDAVFQSVATRNAGNNVVNLVDLSPSMLVLMVGMMYISIYPVYLTRQKTRAPKMLAGEASEETYSEHYDSKISVQSRKLLARDSAHIFVIVFLMCILESQNISHDPLNYSVFNIIFEVISGFGNVGLSVGYSCALKTGNNSSSCQEVPYSFSGKWNRGGKILLVLTMFLGRHRGLPDSLDSALLLPRRVAQEQEFATIQSMAQLSINSSTSWPRRSRDRSRRTSFTDDQGLQLPAHPPYGQDQSSG